MKKVLCIVAFLWGINSAYCQEHATCEDAIPVTTSSYGPITAEGWADSSLCVPNNENMYFGKKHKVVWFSFIVPYDTTLTFEIIPEKPTDDFDFMLFKADKGDFCQKEKEREIKPIRTNFAKPTKYSKGITGLSADAKDVMVPPGFNPPYSAAVSVKKGEWYYLVVDNYVSTKGGFTLKLPFKYNSAKAKATSNKSTIDAMPVKAPPIETPQSASAASSISSNNSKENGNFFLHVLDSANHPIKANLTIDGVQQGKSIKVDAADYSLTLKKYQSIKIRANALGHMPYQSTYFAKGDTSSATFWVRLQPVRASQKITLEDIQFQSGSPNILPSSRPDLDYVLQFLLDNPYVKVIIKGYVNDPDNASSVRYDQNLSEARTKSVKGYLASHGVDNSRMDCVGYGNTRMLYPHPIDEREQQANRRVEIEIQ